MNKRTEFILKVIGSFCVTAVIAGTATLFARNRSSNRQIDENDGVGGLEIPAIPQYEALDKLNKVFSVTEENKTEEVAAETEVTVNVEEAAKEARKDVYALEEAEKKLIDGGLYYYSYRIKPGDMIGVIAERYGVSQDTLISVNKIRATRTIQIGQNIKIPSLDGILYSVKKDGETPKTIAEKYEVSAEEVSNVNHIALDTSLNAGQSIFVPGAALDWVTRQEINGDLFRKPIHGRYRLTSYFGWRGSPFNGRRQFHGGIDMACSKNTPIYAAMEGTIVYKGWSNVYGNYVMIQHHSGYKTLYGHMNSFSNLKVGSYVTTNSVIGYVGTTGMSTGYHVHFTVFKNGRMVNPYNLWG
ncbi:peptidoglycan DD-metalloendopeptidase family protein [Treponema sp.]|uniref:peptidoglycan DD-metalloendopeptidase family protein n=1 Tax=Treponema sp. TaxID=166 RepID=UPI00298E7A58|nr:peptidoglycan DD-metalloendopeptidase family protein [Treponema sp.]